MQAIGSSENTGSVHFCGLTNPFTTEPTENTEKAFNNLAPRRAGHSTITTLTAFETMIQVLNIALMFNPLKVFLSISAFCILAGLGWLG